MKKIAIMTGGRDCPGLNALIRAVVRTAINRYQLQVTGVRSGFRGLLAGDFVNLDNLTVSDILFHGGTILKTSRDPIKLNHQLASRIKTRLDKNQIDGLIIAGGEGTARVAGFLEKKGIPLVFVPATIDNNVSGTEALGFDSVLTNLVWIVDRIKDTAAANPRIFVVELSDDSVGFLTLYLGLTSGVEWLCLPGRPLDIKKIIAGIQAGIIKGKNHQLILTTAQACVGKKIVAALKKAIQLPVKLATLDEIERGGAPTGRDLILAARFGQSAVSVLLKKCDRNFIGIKNNRLFNKSLQFRSGLTRQLPRDLLRLHREISF